MRFHWQVKRVLLPYKQRGHYTRACTCKEHGRAEGRQQHDATPSSKQSGHQYWKNKTKTASSEWPESGPVKPDVIVTSLAASSTADTQLSLELRSQQKQALLLQLQTVQSAGNQLAGSATVTGLNFKLWCASSIFLTESVETFIRQREKYNMCW